MYQVEYSKDIVKDLEKLPKEEKLRVLSKIALLAKNPRVSGAKSLQGNLKGFYRIRSGIYRIVYKIEDKKLVIFIARVAHRSQVYD